MTTQSLIASAISYGFSLKDFDDITIGFLCDVLSEFIPEKDKIRHASQSDIDLL